MKEHGKTRSYYEVLQPRYSSGGGVLQKCRILSCLLNGKQITYGPLNALWLPDCKQRIFWTLLCGLRTSFNGQKIINKIWDLQMSHTSAEFELFALGYLYCLYVHHAMRWNTILSRHSAQVSMLWISNLLGQEELSEYGRPSSSKGAFSSLFDTYLILLKYNKTKINVLWNVRKENF